jgi:hypothetical protein
MLIYIVPETAFYEAMQRESVAVSDGNVVIPKRGVLRRRGVEGGRPSWSPEELVAIRTRRPSGCAAEEAALYVGVSRKAFWNDLRSGRKRSPPPWSTAWESGSRGKYLLREGGTETSPSPGLEPEGKARMDDQVRLLELEMEVIEERLRRIRSRMEAWGWRPADAEVCRQMNRDLPQIEGQGGGGFSAVTLMREGAVTARPHRSGPVLCASAPARSIGSKPAETLGVR